MQKSNKIYIVAWSAALIFYVLEYSTRSAPGVMIEQLKGAFSTTGVGVGGILGAYYYTYSTVSLAAGLALDRYGAKYVVPIGSAILAVGCLLFVKEDPATAYAARLLQGAGSAFAFTGAVYLASRGFSATSLATAIGVTQSLGMLGGSAGQFLVGPLMQIGAPWQSVWIFLGISSAIVAGALMLITPGRNEFGHGAAPMGVLEPYWVVLRNPQSYICGLISGLLFAPTTIGAMTWGVLLLQNDLNFSFQQAVWAASVVPLGWAFGCPLLGWLADRVGRRKPVLFWGAVSMAAICAQLAFAPALIPAPISLFLFGIASGSAMIPYSVIKEVNPDRAKGSATGAINFMVFGVTSLLAPIFAALFARNLTSGSGSFSHFEHAAGFWLVAILAAATLSMLLRETGSRSLPAETKQTTLRPI